MRTVAFAGCGVPLMADIPVCQMMEKLQNSYPERRDELIEMLGIDPHWRMHMLSDGQRRRVQLLIQLVRPFQILLLDEGRIVKTKSWRRLKGTWHIRIWWMSQIVRGVIAVGGILMLQ